MYAIHVVSDNELPPGVRRVLVQMSDGDPLLIMTETAAAEWKPPATRLDLLRIMRDDETLVVPEAVTEFIQEAANGG